MFREGVYRMVVYDDLADAAGAPDATPLVLTVSLHGSLISIWPAPTTLPEGFLQPLGPVLFIPGTVWKDVSGN